MGVAWLGSSDPVPPGLRKIDAPLWRVAAGTDVTVASEVIAVVKKQGWARELSRNADRVAVKLAVDNTLTVTGWVPALALLPVDDTKADSNAGTEPMGPAATNPKPSVRQLPLGGEISSPR